HRVGERRVDLQPVLDELLVGQLRLAGEESDTLDHPTFSLLILIPAFSRSQVSGVTPSLLSRCFCTFWVGVLGSSGITRTKRGTMKCAMRGIRNSISALGSMHWPSTGATATSTSSSANSLGTATAAASRTDGKAATSVSTSKEEMFSPRRRIAS